NVCGLRPPAGLRPAEAGASACQTLPRPGFYAGSFLPAPFKKGAGKAIKQAELDAPPRFGAPSLILRRARQSSIKF
ncbi:MAG: hypothetical protein DBY09_05220, partial [Selenomonadales bacterium]